MSKRPRKLAPPPDERPISFTVLDRKHTSSAKRCAYKTESNPFKTSKYLTPSSRLPLVSKWLKCINAIKSHEDHLLTTGKNVLEAKISAELIDRCALIFGTLIKESELIGFKCKVTDEKTVV